MPELHASADALWKRIDKHCDFLGAQEAYHDSYETAWLGAIRVQAAMYQDFFRATNAGHDIAADDMQKAIAGLQTVSAELEKLQQQAPDDENSSTFSRFNKDFVLTMFAKCNCELSCAYLWRANRRTPWDYQNIRADLQQACDSARKGNIWPHDTWRARRWPALEDLAWLAGRKPAEVEPRGPWLAKLPKQEHDFEEVAFAQVWPRAIEAFKSENATAERLDLENKIGQGRAGYRWVVFGGGDLAKLNDAKRVLEEVVPDVNQAKTKKSETVAEACYWLAKTHDIVDSDKIDQGDYVLRLGVVPRGCRRRARWFGLA